MQCATQAQPHSSFCHHLSTNISNKIFFRPGRHNEAHKITIQILAFENIPKCPTPFTPELQAFAMLISVMRFVDQSMQG